MRRVLLEIWHDLDGLGKCLTTLLTDLEGRFFELNKFEKGCYVWIAHYIVEVLDKDRVNETRMRGHPLNLKHLAHFEDLLSYSRRVFELFADLFGEVVR